MNNESEKIISKPSSSAYRSNWEKIFGFQYTSFQKGDFLFYFEEEVIFISFSIETRKATVRNLKGEYFEVELETLKKKEKES